MLALCKLFQEENLRSGMIDLKKMKKKELLKRDFWLVFPRRASTINFFLRQQCKKMKMKPITSMKANYVKTTVFSSISNLPPQYL